MNDKFIPPKNKILTSGYAALSILLLRYKALAINIITPSKTGLNKTPFNMSQIATVIIRYNPTVLDYQGRHTKLVSCSSSAAATDGVECRTSLPLTSYIGDVTVVVT